MRARAKWPEAEAVRLRGRREKPPACFAGGGESKENALLRREDLSTGAERNTYIVIDAGKDYPAFFSTGRPLRLSETM
jgi:hypothetical protein